MRRLQEPQLHVDEEQEEEPGPAGIEEVLPRVPSPHATQGSEVGSGQKAVGDKKMAMAEMQGSLLTAHGLPPAGFKGASV